MKRVMIKRLSESLEAIMRWASACCMAAFLLLFTGCSPQVVPRIEKPNLVYLTESSDFTGLTSSGLVLVDFYADWCPPCRELSPELVRLAEDAPDDLLILKINVDHHGELAREHGVRSIPHLVLLREGRTVGRLNGFQSKESLETWIQERRS